MKKKKKQERKDKSWKATMRKVDDVGPVFHIGEMALARSRSKPTTSLPGDGIFAPYKFPKSVIPKGVPLLSQDSSISEFTEWGNTSIRDIIAEGLTFLGYPALAEMAQRPEYRVMSEVIATEATRKGVEFKSNSSEDDKSDKIALLKAKLEAIDAWGVLRRTLEIDGQFGRGHIYINTGSTEDPEELKTSIGNGRDEVSKIKLKKGCLQGLKAIEPVWTYPTSYNSNNPLRDDWYNPQQWFVMGQQVHVTRLLRIVSREVPDMLKPAYAFGGLSLTQMAKPYVDNWLRTRQSVSDIIHAFTVFVLSTDLSTLMQGDGGQLFERAELFNNLRDNRGLMMVNKNSEDFKNVSAPLSTLDALQAQSQEQLASVTRIPLVKLLGTSPAGLNASSEGEIRVFYDTIASYQEKVLRHPIKTITDIAQISLWGMVDPDITFDFAPLWALDEKGIAEVRKIEADTHAVYLTEGVVTNGEVRKVVAGDEDTLYPGLDVDAVPEDPMAGGGEEDMGGGKRLGLMQGGGLGSTPNDFAEAAE